MSEYSPEKAVVFWRSGEEAEIAISEARSLRDDGFLTFVGRRRGVAVFREKVHGADAAFRSRWVKDRGVIGGKYGIPFEPNGHYAQFMLVR